MKNKDDNVNKNQIEIFFNTISLSGHELVAARKDCFKQDERVLQILHDRGGKMTPFEVSAVYNSKYPEAPITSIRRSMTVLTKKGQLEMLDEMKQEKYGKPNHYWKAVV